MDMEQQAALDAALKETGHPLAAATATPEPAAPAPAQPAPQATEAAQEPQAEQASRHKQILDRMIENARKAREEQAKAKQSEEAQQHADYARKLLEAKQYGKDALLQAAGIKEEKIDLGKLLGYDDKKDQDEPPSVRELKDRIGKLDDYIESLKREREEEKVQFQQQQQQLWLKQEIGNINRVIEENSKKYEYVASTRTMGSDKDLMNGLVLMHNQGLDPSYEDMADMVEARIEEVLNLVAKTDKFSNFVKERFGININKPKDTRTLTSVGGETPAAVSWQVTDEENRKMAIQEALAVKESLLKQVAGK